MTDLVLVDRPTAGVAVLTLNRREKYNALSTDLVAQLHAAFVDLAADDALRALVLTGADPAFCAGLDLGELSEGAAFSPDTLEPLRALPVPVLGAINGVAITGGLELALSCDFRIGSERARFADTHARVGITPAWGLTARLPQAVGQSWARQMSMTGDFVDAATAFRIGLLNEVVEHAALLDRCIALATSIASTDKATATRVRQLYDIQRDQSGSAALAAELEERDRVVIADTEAFAARRDDVFSRGRGQSS